MSTDNAKKPQLKDYLDVSHYLKDLYGYRKAHEELEGRRLFQVNLNLFSVSSELA